MVPLFFILLTESWLLPLRNRACARVSMQVLHVKEEEEGGGTGVPTALTPPRKSELGSKRQPGSQELTPDALPCQRSRKSEQHQPTQ